MSGALGERREQFVGRAAPGELEHLLRAAQLVEVGVRLAQRWGLGAGEGCRGRFHASAPAASLAMAWFASSRVVACSSNSTRTMPKRAHIDTVRVHTDRDRLGHTGAGMVSADLGEAMGVGVEPAAERRLVLGERVDQLECVAVERLAVVAERFDGGDGPSGLACGAVVDLVPDLGRGRRRVGDLDRQQCGEPGVVLFGDHELRLGDVLEFARHGEDELAASPVEDPEDGPHGVGVCEQMSLRSGPERADGFGWCGTHARVLRGSGVRATPRPKT
ncbi:MAG: hypothetical protein HND58_18535 [Planctomycetota bacterium]|nr:MAG: hypothetical protein HND58_18535 [Planctomycetota bacterium]